MSFKCQKCNRISEVYEKQNTLIIEKRDRSYHYYVVKIRGNYGKTKEIYTEIKPDPKDKNKQILKEFTTKGWEIVRALKVCGRCVNV